MGASMFVEVPVTGFTWCTTATTIKNKGTLQLAFWKPNTNVVRPGKLPIPMGSSRVVEVPATGSTVHDAPLRHHQRYVYFLTAQQQCWTLFMQKTVAELLAHLSTKLQNLFWFDFRLSSSDKLRAASCFFLPFYLLTSVQSISVKCIQKQYNKTWKDKNCKWPNEMPTHTSVILW